MLGYVMRENLDTVLEAEPSSFLWKLLNGTKSPKSSISWL